MDEEKKLKQIRRDVLTMLFDCQSGHPGGSLSCVEIIAALYYHVMKIDAANPHMESRDRFVLSKGHACPTLYAVLADLGFFAREDLWSLRQVGSHLQGHPDMTKTPGIDVNTGSLGQGASVAVGMALAAKRRGADYRVFAVLGDGECQEGIVWEAAMAAAHYKLDNLVFILDHNGLQIDGSNDSVMSLGDIVKKFDAFGFHTQSVDGHDMDALVKAFSVRTPNMPSFVDCRTVKGKGVSFMENNFGWHGRAPKKEEYDQAMAELEA